MKGILPSGKRVSLPWFMFRHSRLLRNVALSMACPDAEFEDPGMHEMVVRVVEHICGRTGARDLTDAERQLKAALCEVARREAIPLPNVPDVRTWRRVLQVVREADADDGDGDGAAAALRPVPGPLAPADARRLLQALPDAMRLEVLALLQLPECMGRDPLPMDGLLYMAVSAALWDFSTHRMRADADAGTDAQRHACKQACIRLIMAIYTLPDIRVPGSTGAMLRQTMCDLLVNPANTVVRALMAPLRTAYATMMPMDGDSTEERASKLATMRDYMRQGVEAGAVNLVRFILERIPAETAIEWVTALLPKATKAHRREVLRGLLAWREAHNAPIDPATAACTLANVVEEAKKDANMADGAETAKKEAYEHAYMEMCELLLDKGAPLWWPADMQYDAFGRAASATSNGLLRMFVFMVMEHLTSRLSDQFRQEMNLANYVRNLWRVVTQDLEEATSRAAGGLITRLNAVKALLRHKFPEYIV